MNGEAIHIHTLARETLADEMMQLWLLLSVPLPSMIPVTWVACEEVPAYALPPMLMRPPNRYARHLVWPQTAIWITSENREEVEHLPCWRRSDVSAKRCTPMSLRLTGIVNRVRMF
jgi:hypothetical protein